MVRNRLRIAAQKSGRLADPARELLARAGLAFRQSRDRLFCFGETFAIDLLLVRDDDIPGLIAQGACDLGIVGRNVLMEQTLAAQSLSAGAPCVELVPLGFGRCRLSIAAPELVRFDNARSLVGLRIATTYPRLLENWLAREHVDAKIVELSGSVEIAPNLGTADAICDLVSSGATLAANQLRELATVFESEAVLVGPEDSLTGIRAELLDDLVRRVTAVLTVRDTRLLMLRAPRSCIDSVRALLPLASNAIVMGVDGQGDEVALQAICPSDVNWAQLEGMKRAGAHSMLVLPVERMLA
ncbi:MAG: ATP phosphoribosyltransferase [Lysobacterales bacterium]